MRRIVSLLLILLVLGNQSFCAPHSHAGTSIVEPEGHSTRPHIHLDVGKHHDRHSHGKDGGHESHKGSRTIRAEQGPIDHDSDALYFSETQLFNDAKLAKVAKAEMSRAHVVYDDSATVVALHLCRGLDSPPPLGGLKCPIYLVTLSIRC